ncbi:murein hydrolase activator EnvC family protein [Calorimonas adulescens]|jgi:Peptidase family M23./Tho complex subunit 7.|uniref:Peptidoglycan DD-metalloendopeptidase family protein n=1 Tax=Calorimonas adulescens TaxID=2606906 RepID=A0A5D8QG36_9THEO|nr:M23 family metallopeptidase [Calorimonas adulescens]TZE83114.1 peptidoglycan DD-metalloendopeptidase family protein [Calorimonas adulescens]
MRFKKIVSFVIIPMIAFSLFAGTVNADTLNDYMKQKQTLDKKIKETKGQINTVEKQKNQYLQELEELDRKIEETNTQLETLQVQLNQIQRNYDQTQKALEQAQNMLKKEEALYKERVRAMYINGPTGYLEVLLDSTDFSDFISRLDMIQRVIDYDNNLLDEMKSNRDAIEAQKQKLLDQKAQLLSTRNQIDLRKKELKDQETDRSLLVQRLEAQKEELEAALDEFEQESVEIGNMIKKLQAKSKLTYNGGVFAWPAPEYTRISDPYGWRIHPILKTKKFHSGVDIATPMGSKIVAAADGEVIFAGVYGGYGNAIIIDHGSGLSTLYGHNSKLLVKVGDKVVKGQQIAEAGSTGLSTGSHLHFEVRKDGTPVDPMPYLK